MTLCSLPYRRYNLDMLDYEVDKPSALYGSIPFMLGHRKGMTCGFMWNNPSETFIDVWREVGSISIYKCTRSWAGLGFLSGVYFHHVYPPTCRHRLCVPACLPCISVWRLPVLTVYIPFLVFSFPRDMDHVCLKKARQAIPIHGNNRSIVS